MDQRQLTEAAQALQDACRARKISVSVAESLTAGLVGSTLAEISGASSYFRGGVICYTDQVKVDVLNVALLTIEERGAVSRKCAKEMVRGVNKLFDTKASVAVTGEAGPKSASGKPVGRVWVAWSVGGQVDEKKFNFVGDRNEIRQQAAHVAISLLTDAILNHPSAKL
ncbi:MAG: CinA family protein [Coriobacteriia bacterium]|nr:CinA family protein [Coriobacteriia bacterium]